MIDRLHIELDDAELQARLAHAAQQLEHPRELLDRIGAVLELNVNLRFDAKKAPDGTAWLPLAPSTVRRYNKKYNGNIPGSLLQRTRHMRNSLTHNATDEFAEVGFNSQTDTTKAGDVYQKAMLHEFGTSQGMPRRQLLTDDPVTGTLGAEDRDDVLQEISDWLAEML